MKPEYLLRSERCDLTACRAINRLNPEIINPAFTNRISNGLSIRCKAQAAAGNPFVGIKQARCSGWPTHR